MLDDDSLHLHDTLPVKLEALEHFPDEFPLALANEGNEAFLRANMTLFESHEMEEHDELRMELRRMDQKLRLLMEMVSELLAGQADIPPPGPVELSPRGMECRTAMALRAGDKLRVSLYINPLLPKALRLFGSAETDAAAGESVRIRFHGLSQGVEDSLDKMIFRHHRREVAQQRAHREAHEEEGAQES